MTFLLWKHVDRPDSVRKVLAGRLATRQHIVRSCNILCYTSYTRLNLYIYIYIYIYVCMYIFMCMYIYIYRYTHIYIYIYIDIDI